MYELKEKIDREKLEQLQLVSLQKMIDYAIKNVTFYKNIFEQYNIVSGKQLISLSDISKLPFTTKRDMQKEYPKGFLAVPMNKVARIHASSGSTGSTKKQLTMMSDFGVTALMATPTYATYLSELISQTKTKVNIKKFC